MKEETKEDRRKKWPEGKKEQKERKKGRML